MPVWLLALQIALQTAPAIVQAINVANLPSMTPDQVAVLQAAMDKAVADYEAAISN